jgi:hypothetical protein
MKKIADLIERELTWSQPRAFKMEYELRAGEELAATLRFRTMVGTMATGESADGCWTFKRVGFWHPRVTIRARDSEQEIAVFRNNTWQSGGTLELPDGRHLQASTNFWATRFAFTGPGDEPLVEFTTGMIRPSATVTVRPSAARLTELPWIVMLGWYLVVMMQSDATAATMG